MKTNIPACIVCFVLGLMFGSLLRQSFDTRSTQVIKTAPYTLMRILCLFDNDAQPGDYVTLSDQAAGRCHAVKDKLVGVPIVGIARQTGNPGDDGPGGCVHGRSGE
jgi:hypothetical protein